MRTKTTHIARMRAEYASNQQLIRTELGLSTEAYNALQFETGCAFLENIYPATEGLGKYYRTVSRCSFFWDWWRHEWRLEEADALCMLEEAGLSPKARLRSYTKQMAEMADSTQIDHAYHHNCLKHISHLLQ